MIYLDPHQAVLCALGEMTTPGAHKPDAQDYETLYLHTRIAPASAGPGFGEHQNDPRTFLELQTSGSTLQEQDKGMHFWKNSIGEVLCKTEPYGHPKKII